MIILDTDHCIEILRGNRKILNVRSRRPEQTVIAWVTVGELYYGAAKSKDPEGMRSLVEAFLLTVEVKFPTIGTMKLFGEVKARLSREGSNLPDADLLIGSVALESGALLVTGNFRHFERIPGIRLDNWIK